MFIVNSLLYSGELFVTYFPPEKISVEVLFFWKVAIKSVSFY